MLVKFMQPYTGGKISTCLHSNRHGHTLWYKMGVQRVYNNSFLVVISAKHTQLRITGVRLRNMGVNIRNKVKNPAPAGLRIESDFLNVTLNSSQSMYIFSMLHITSNK